MHEEIEAWERDRTLDAIGLACPLPVPKARKILAGMRAGERLLVAASDPMAAIDIPHLCVEDGHWLEKSARHPDPTGARLFFLVVVGDGPKRDFSLGEEESAAEPPQDEPGGANT
jgi:tRNA 2-thiouridine synthesizing protein A